MMKQIIQSYKSGELWLVDVPVPVCKSGGILVQTKASLVSAGTEKQMTKLAKMSLLGKARTRPDLVKRVLEKVKNEGILSTLTQVKTKLDTPISLGYSCAGIVIEVGAGVTEFQLGDRVACGGAGYATHAEVNWVPKNLCVRIPRKTQNSKFKTQSEEDNFLFYEEAAFATVGAIALQGVRQADVRLGENVVVIGLGLIGQITVQLLKACGCRVLGSDIDEDKCKIARALGTNEVTQSSKLKTISERFTSGYGADAVIITASTNSSDLVNIAGEICRLKGKIVVVGFVGMDIDHQLYYKKELDLRMSMSYGPGRYDPNYEEQGNDYPYAYVRWTERRNMDAFLNLIAQGKINVNSLITHRYSINKAMDAYSLLEGKERYLGIIIEYNRDQNTLRKENFFKLPIKKVKKVVHSNNKVNIGLIGAGNFTRGVLLPVIKKTNKVKLIGLATATGMSGFYTGKKNGFRYCTTDLEKIFEDEKINTVFITTRHNTHAELVIKALKSGKNVFVEKPLCVDERELNEIVQTFKHSNIQRLLMVGFNRRFSPYSQKLKDFFKGISPLIINYRVNAGALPPDHWFYSEEGKGRIIGEGVHFIDFGIFLTDAMPVKIYAESADEGDKENVNITIKFSNGSISTISYFALGDRSLLKEYVEVFGGGKVGLLSDYRRLELIENGKKKTMRSFGQRKGHKEEIEVFFDRIIHGGDLPIPFEQLCLSTMTSFKVIESLEKGLPVQI